jgi:CO/xanthine dehydrogenase Mo-binding subunit
MAEAAAPDFSVVGRRLPRVDADEKVTGRAEYVADVILPGMLWGAVLRSPYPHARILHVDTSRARRLPGVRAAVTADDTPKRTWGAFVRDQPVLVIDRVRYVGEEIAAVAAVDLDMAREAVELIDVEYEELPAVFDAEEAMAAGAPILHEDRGTNVAMTIDVERGDVERAFAESAVVVEGTFESHPQWHAAIETIGSVAQFNPNGKLTVWMNTQTLFMARGRIAWALDLNESDVRIIQPYVGGGFGGKSCDDNNALVCAVLARASGRPVKLINTREEEFLAGSRPRVPMKIWVKLGFQRDGLVQAKQIRLVADNGAYCGKAPGVFGVSSLRHDTGYQYPNVKVQSFLVYTNKIPTGAFRGFGNPSAEWAVEQAWDMAADRLGIDPLDLALMNAAEPGYISPHGNRVISCELKQCLEKAGELMDWRVKRASTGPRKFLAPASVGTSPPPSPSPVEGEGRQPPPPSPNPQSATPGPLRGLGQGTTVHVSGKRHFGDYEGGSAIIKVSEDGKAFIWSGEGEIGQGSTTVLCQIAAEELGLPYDDVSISQADTDLTTYCHGAYASRLTYVAGNAVKNAAANAKAQLLETAAEQLEVSLEDLEVRHGRVFIRGAPEGPSLTVAQVARARLFRRGGQPIVAAGSFDSDSVLQDETRYGNESGAYNFGAQMAEVEVDPETGQVTVLEYVSVADCGTVVNPVAAEGQQQGAIAQGIGYALTEGMVMDEGRPLNANFGDYRLPCTLDMPPLKIDFAESYEPTGPFGAKGLGELGLDPTAAVIANAVYDACGVRITQLPITAEKILEGLQGR